MTDMTSLVLVQLLDMPTQGAARPPLYVSSALQQQVSHFVTGAPTVQPAPGT